MIYRGVAVDLLIGDGGSVINNPFPMIYGKKPNEVKHLLHSNALNIGKETYLDVADSTASRAYKIEPYFKPGEAVRPGTYVNIFYKSAERINFNEFLRDSLYLESADSTTIYEEEI